MPGMNGQGSRGPQGGRRCQGGQGRGMGRGNGGGQGRGQGQGNGQQKRMGVRQGQTMGQGMNWQESGDTADVESPEGSSAMPRVTKVAVTSEGPTLEDRVDPRFGRAGGFTVVNLETMETEYVDNGGSQVMAQGAGIQAAENVANAGAEAILSGYVGPKAFTALEAAGILVGQDVEDMTVGEAIDKFKRGEIPMATGPNRQAGGKA